MIFKNLKNEIKLDELFRFDEKTNSYIIDISIDNYGTLYSSLDFSPFKNRDLDDELIIYLEHSVEDIPFKYNILLNINMPQNIYDEVQETRGIKEIKNYFSYLHRKKKREIYEYYRSAVRSFVLGILFIFAVSFIKKNFAVTRVVWQLIIEGFYVGGWVFLWEFFSLLFLEPNSKRRKLKQYQRVLDSKITCTYH
ncbi:MULTISPECIES: hypothetical protein [Psychrilyobacter]|uniref:Uncharacterized protein n=1 Tax=Psychrilyobacter piezotolerans TaxID=2293438 RepID=A0ABX9KET4_9FUSO|nr:MULTISPECIES: hypothetical protein [Psychrilyobacter]MCS5421680.1 hypothetical protein [Psychrilyobacter sp. S5]NDI78816.1 hypothetical protein [Psychrilyobacter piezotolerans]RDE59522.1 hypothetical protein DV867_12785 [Psychrilyobacter sp. S5]REI39962.1 hypothetical protein DYH56_12785 [Psychrilyobacter piezotolerans]